MKTVSLSTGLAGGSQLSVSSPVTRQCTEGRESCRPAWGVQCVQDGKKDFLNCKQGRKVPKSLSRTAVSRG